MLVEVTTFLACTVTAYAALASGFLSLVAVIVAVPGATAVILPSESTVTPDTANKAYMTWTSSNEAIATVDSEGKITAVAPGTATITATSDSNPDASAAYAVTVQAKKVVVPANTKTSSKSSSSNAGNSSNSGAAAAAPSNPVPAPDPAPVQPSEPAPAPDPQPDPAPAEPQPDNRDYTDGSGANGGKVIEGRADNSCTPEQEAGGV